jgi:hypothetical protein
MNKIFCLLVMIFLPLAVSWGASVPWESQGNYYFLAKNTRDSFSAIAPGANKFSGKYLNYDGVDFLVKGPDNWQDYGRLDLQENHLFKVPIRSGMKLDEVHFLASGSYSNSYTHDSLLHFFGDKYFYSTITVMFVYQDGLYRSLAVPVFWDWFYLPSIEWSKDGANVKSSGRNPMRPDCNMYHIWFINPRPAAPVKDVLLMDSWLRDLPFSDIFAVTVKSSDKLDAIPKGYSS